jgi:16S rRNA (guanine527-N7)-methyltransferase
MTLEARIQDGAERMALALPEGAVAKCTAYLRLLEKWNRVHNLTAVRETERMVVLHLLDSFSVLPHIEDAQSILDVGSGGGLPGIPIAIARPDLRVVLLDSSNKKTTFLEQARAELALTHVEVVCARVEQWRPDHLFDAVVSRAFADLGEFVAQAQHVVAPNGRLLAMKGVYPFEEIARLPATHRVAQVAELHVPELDAKRHLVFVERTQAA